MKKLATYKIIGIISIGYGIAFAILDKIDYIIQVEYFKGLLTEAFPDPIMLRIPNLIFSIALILGGYFLIQKKKESWYLYNFSFIGILSKYIFTIFIMSPIAIGNFLYNFGFHFIIAIFGLIFINKKKFKVEFQVNPKRRILKYLSITFLSLCILFLYGFEYLINQKTDRKEHYQEVLDRTHLYGYYIEDSCYFAYDFRAIIDTLEEIDIYSQIEILQVDSNMNPLYGERLSIFENDVQSDYYFYNDSGMLIRFIKEKEYHSRNFDTLIYTYYNNDKIKAVTEIYYSFREHDTMTYHYNYFKGGDTIYYSDDKEYNYCYVSNLNSSNCIVETKQVKGNSSSGIIKYEYNSNDQLTKIIKYNQKEDNQKSVELFFYDEDGLLLKTVTNIYEESSGKLTSKELTIFVYKNKINDNNEF